ncbi:ABC transporter permease [Planctomycetota bacterium]
MFLDKLLAYLKRSLRIELSYRFAFGLSILSAIINLLIFYFIDRLFGAQMVSHLEPYGVNYFAYVLVAMTTSTFIGTTVGAVASQIQREQSIGTLEALLITPTSLYTLVIIMIGWSLVHSFINFILYLAAGIFVFNINFANVNLISVLAIMILVIVSFNALGIISAGFILIYKRGNPIAWLISLGYELIGGVYFPITVLPEWLQHLAYLFPVTHAIKAIQLAVYRGASIGTLQSHLLILLLFCIILVPLSMLSLRYSFKRARREGTLVHY